MQKSKIEWCDSTWNPVTGCLHGCEYCYARRIAARFGHHHHEDGTNHYLGEPMAYTPLGKDERIDPYPFSFDPTFHSYRLCEPCHHRGQNIFVCSMADLFGEWVPDGWIAKVLDACLDSPQNRYLFLTKNPSRYMELAEAGMLPEYENFWYGSSVPTSETPFWWSDRHNTFISIEPMLEEFPTGEGSPVEKVKWVIMGAMTGPGSNRHQPKREWVESIARDAQAAGVPVFMKDSLIPFVSEAYWIRDFPWEGGEQT